MVLRMKQALAEWPIPERSLLDLACGTGTLAHWWARHHPRWEVWGVDRSAAMIERARASSSKASRPPTFVVQDLTELDLDRRFGFASCFFDSLNHVTRAHDLSRILKGVYRSLLPGGLFIFDL